MVGRGEGVLRNIFNNFLHSVNSGVRFWAATGAPHIRGSEYLVGHFLQITFIRKQSQFLSLNTNVEILQVKVFPSLISTTLCLLFLCMTLKYKVMLAGPVIEWQPYP